MNKKNKINVFVYICIVCDYVYCGFDLLAHATIFVGRSCLFKGVMMYMLFISFLL